MALPLLVPIALGVTALGGLIFAVTRKPAVSAAAAAKATTLAQQFTTTGPSGERVFRPDVAEGLVRALPSQRFSELSSEPISSGAFDASLVEIKPEPSGAAVPLDQSALGWVRANNATKSILAPLFLATPSSARRFLRAVPAGQEAQFAGPSGIYAVLIYAGTIARNLPPPGQPGLGGGRVPAGPLDDLPPEIAAAVADLLNHGQNPEAMDQVAAELEKEGFSGAAALLRKRAAEIRRGQVVPTTPAIFVPSVPSVLPGVPVPAPEIPIVPTAPAPTAPAPTAPAQELRQLFIKAPSGLNLRNAPETGTILAKMPFRAAVTATGPARGPTSAAAPQGWTPVTFQGKSGFASSEWLSVTQPPPAAAPAAPPITPATPAKFSPGDAAIITAPSGLNLRSKPATTGAILKTLPKGTKVLVVDQTDPKLPGGPGNAKWLKVVWEFPTPPTLPVFGFVSIDWVAKAPQ